MVRAFDWKLERRGFSRLLSGINLRQVVHTHVPLSPSSINWYRSEGDDDLRLGR